MFDGRSFTHSSRHIRQALALAALLAAECIQAQPYGLANRPAVGPFLNGVLPPAESVVTGWQVVDAFPNLRFNSPTIITPQPGTNRIFVGEQQGKIFHFPNISSTTNKVLFLDLTAKNQAFNDCGLLGLAFHPQFGVPGSTNRGYVYVYYNYSPSPVPAGPAGYADSETDSYNRLSRFTVPDGSSVADPNSELVLINQFDRHLWHSGGGLFFGKDDGFLYLSNGDEGGVSDPFNQAQKITNGLFSGVLRIDVDKDPTRSHPIRRQPLSGSTPPGGWPSTYSSNYFIPNDNPWTNAAGSNLEEFYAIGFRSPHRMTQDPVTGQIWLGDVGQNDREEVNLVEKGGNYQWAYREGNAAGPKAKPTPLIGIDKPPIHDYAHANGHGCVIGGYVYRGASLPALYGKYIFGDYVSGQIWAMDYSATTPVVTPIASVPDGSFSLTTFGLDQSQELLFGEAGSQKPIYKLVPVGTSAPPPPALLSQTGAFSNLTNLTVSSGLIPYEINSPLWSDHASKFRWMAVPTNSTITYSDTGNWTFPIGTVLVKHFDLPVNDTNPAITKRLETRFLTRSTNGTWLGYTYKWRADNSDADLLPGSLNETNLITTATGTRTQVWSYPSRADCLSCHNANAGAVLGPRTSQFNRDNSYPSTGLTDNQLRALNHVGLFNTNLNEAAIPGLPALASVTNTNASPELRVRSYLQANCAHCHQPNGARGFFDARFSTPLAQQNLIGGPVDNNLGIIGAHVVAPMSTNKSILFVRDAALGANQMPPLAKNVVDTNYINVLAEWINTLPPLPLPPPSVLGRMGNTNTSGTSDYIWANGAYINAGRFTAASNLTVAFIHANVLGLTGRYQTALYSDNSGTPSTLVASSFAVTNPATGWQKMPLTAPASLLAGVNYWLAIWSDSANARVYCNTNGGTLRWGQYNFTNVWPNPIVTEPIGSDYNYNIYASGGSAPVFAGTPTNRTIAELSTLIATNIATDADAPFQKVSYALANPPLGATISSNGVITWTPSSTQGPSTNAIITVANDGVVAITNSFQVIVLNVNAAPVAFSQSLTNAEDTVLPILLTGSDPDGPSMTFFVVTNPAHGNLSGTIPNLNYLPVTNYFGPDNFAFRIHDGSLTSAVALVSLGITNVNDAPTPQADQLLRWMSQGIATLATNLLTNDLDPDGDLLTLTQVLSPTTQGATVSLSNATVRYWPSFGNTNADSFGYLLSDGQGGGATGLVTVAVQPDPPITELLGIVTGTGSYQLSFDGVPGFTYTIQYTDDLEPANWLNLGTVTADELGNVQTEDNTSGNGPSRFYRAVRGIVP